MKGLILVWTTFDSYFFKAFCQLFEIIVKILFVSIGILTASFYLFIQRVNYFNFFVSTNQRSVKHQWLLYFRFKSFYFEGSIFGLAWAYRKPHSQKWSEFSSRALGNPRVTKTECQRFPWLGFITQMFSAWNAVFYRICRRLVAFVKITVKF